MSDAGTVAPLLVCNIGWMSHYEGLDGKPDKIIGGGQFVRQYKRGNEVCNFLPCGDGNVYGHVETIKKDQDRQIKIENLTPRPGAFNADRLNGVDVVWIATNPDVGGRRVVGWYRDATVYRDRQDFPKSLLTRQHKRDKIDSYRVRAARENVTLLPLKDRSGPALRLGTGKGWIGEANWWFPARQTDPAIRKFVGHLREFISGYDEGSDNRGTKSRWGGASNMERKAQVEQAAIEAIKRYYKNHIVKTVEKDNLGWDLEVTPIAGGGTICIEVKGLFGQEFKVGVTPNEYRALSRHMKGSKPDYRFCVVTGSLSERLTLTILRYKQEVGTWFDDVLGRRMALKIDLLQSAIISQDLAE